MKELLLNASFWSALTNLAWPAVAVFLLIRFQPLIAGLLRRENMQIKVGSLEISVQEAAKIAGKDIVDLQQRLSKLETAYADGEPVSAHPEETRTAEKLKPKRLLWVDDFPSNNAFLVANLQEKGVEIVLSLGTEDAIEKLKYDGFSAIITDMGRIEHGVDNPFAGLDLIKRARALNKDIPILVFAGKRGVESRDILVKAGAENATSSGVEVISFAERHLGIA